VGVGVQMSLSVPESLDGLESYSLVAHVPSLL
jgi:hypothetical protein